MTKNGNKQHEKILRQIAGKLQSEGNKIVILNGKCPDAVGIINDKLVAIDIMGHKEIKGKYSKKYTHEYSWHTRMKIKEYQNLGFDDVVIYPFTYENTDDYNKK